VGLGCVVCGFVVRRLRLVSWGGGGGVCCGEWDEDRGNGSGMRLLEWTSKDFRASGSVGWKCVWLWSEDVVCWRRTWQ